MLWSAMRARIAFEFRLSLRAWLRPRCWMATVWLMPETVSVAGANTRLKSRRVNGLGRYRPPRPARVTSWCQQFT